MSALDLLMGAWVSDPEDQEGVQEFGHATLEFEEDGQLTYTVHAEGKDQKMFLVFRVEGDTLVTNQPSSPREEQTAYSFDPGGRLTLWFGGQRSVYVRGAQ
jgi:hypothetical protein